MSLIHISLAQERSKRLTGWLRGGAGGCHLTRPSSCRIRLTCVSLTPRWLKRASTSRIRLVPYSGWCCFSSMIASRLPRAASLRGRVPPLLRLRGTSAAAPPCSYLLSQLRTAVVLTSKASATSDMGIP